MSLVNNVQVSNYLPPRQDVVWYEPVYINLPFYISKMRNDVKSAVFNPSQLLENLSFHIVPTSPKRSFQVATDHYNSFISTIIALVIVKNFRLRATKKT